MKYSSSSGESFPIVASGSRESSTAKTLSSIKVCTQDFWLPEPKEDKAQVEKEVADRRCQRHLDEEGSIGAGQKS